MRQICAIRHKLVQFIQNIWQSWQRCSRLGASVAVKFSQEFATQVSWQKVDERTGAEIPDEDIIDGGGDEPTPTPSGDDDLEG